MLHRKRDSGHQPQSLEFPERDGTPVGNAAYRCGRPERPSHERHFLAERPGFIFLRDDMPMRIDLRIAEDCRDAIFKSFGDEVLQPFCLFMHLVPGVLQHVMQKQFQQTVVPDQLPRPAFAGRSEPDTVMFFIQNQGRMMRCELLKHSGHRRSTNSKPLGQGIRRYARVLRPAQLENGLKVVVNRFRRFGIERFSCH